ncbi:spermidine/putrescine ABC transporter substrate-binding protein [Thalassobacillus devorans]|uniref:Spermidine/putrescine ABC transporter substrate-binding protein n=1 Tax=Thalassobacillus devorans TaxID=279813 RepID=A0ABQ1NZK1_9BACI|nr:extracellular solute-binding protein [Thalassobacillus devorans]NIK28218.1 putative spermidine/putrescine transport system substrate-binding protein [Thalassobacillus devorans]GGC87968.1 spermidine/putrescine ABC transporter substrate-binding protein [Thalassobacillus devorans]
MRKFSLFLSMMVLLLMLAACGGDKTSSGETNSEVVVGAWGGDYQQFLTDYVNPKFKEANSDTEVVYVPSDASSRLTKLRVEKEGNGTFDVVQLSYDTIQEMIDEEIMMKLDYSKIPNSENIKPNLENPYFVPHIYSAGVLLYNEKLVKEEPQSWEVLWDPKYKGKVGVYVDVFDRWLYAAAAVEGNTEGQNWEKSWDKFASITKQNPKFYTSQEALGTALKTGEIALTIGWKSRAVQWNESGGDPIGNTIPQEGTYPRIYGGGIPANAQNVEAAYDYLNAMLEPEAQVEFAANMGYDTTVVNAEMSDELIEDVGFSKEETKLVKSVDLGYVSENYAAWKQKFDREIASE